MKRHWTEWPDSLYEKFMKYPEWVRIAIAIGSVLAILILFSIPGSTIIAAVIAFGATFSGIFVSFWVERRRREAEDKKQFGHILQSVLVETERNYATLNHIKKTVSPGGACPESVFTDALQAALSDPLFHRWADPGLIAAASFVRSQLGAINNLLSGYLVTAALGTGMTERDATDLRMSVEVALDCIPVMQEVLRNTMGEHDAETLTNGRSKEIRDRLGKIVLEHRRRQAEASAKERSQ